MLHFLHKAVRVLTFQPSRRVQERRKLDMLDQFRVHFEWMQEAAHDLEVALRNGLNGPKSVKTVCDLFGSIYTCRIWLKDQWKVLKGMAFKDYLISETQYDEYVKCYQQVYKIANECGVAVYGALIAAGLAKRSERKRYFGDIVKERKAMK